MTTFPHKHRDPATQERLNDHMRRPDVLEYLLFQALHAEPAAPEQVNEFLVTAPPEVFVALDGLLPAGHGPINDQPPQLSPARGGVGSVHENPIVQGLVGLVRAAGDRR